MEVITGTGHWYKAGEGLVAVLWVFVHDLSGTHRDDYFFTTDLSLTATQVIEFFTGRWSIETTFQEMRAYLGLETTRGRKKETVSRLAPCLFGLYTVVAALYAQMPARYQRTRLIDWVGKTDTTFSDAITGVRRWLWQEWIFATPGHTVAFSKLSRPFRELLLCVWRRPRSAQKTAEVEYSPDSKVVLTGSVDGTLRLWDAATAEPIGTPLVHQGAVLSVAFSPTGKLAISGGRGKAVQEWNLATRLPLRAPFSVPPTSTWWPSAPTARRFRPGAPTVPSMNGNLRLVVRPVMPSPSRDRVRRKPTASVAVASASEPIN